MSIKESISFSYDNKYSTEFDIKNIALGDAIQEEHFVAPREINEIKIRGRDKPYFQDIEYENINIPLTLWFAEGFTNESIREVARWLTVKKFYRPLFFSDNTNRIFYAICTGEPSLIHDTLKNGYMEIVFRTNAPYAFSLPILTEKYTVGATPEEITLINNGDLPVYLEMFIKKTTEDGIITITNVFGGEEFILGTISDQLLINEEIYVNGENQYIESTEKPRYDVMSGVFLQLERGQNHNINIDGRCEIKFRYHPKLISG